MDLREATLKDVPAILRIRRYAKENELEFKLTEKMIYKALKRHCKAFVVEEKDEVIAFAMANRLDKNIWGLFVWEPFQGRGLGRVLLSVAVDWLFQQKYGVFRKKLESITLTTQQSSPAQCFYEHLGFKQIEVLDNGEVLLEITREKAQQTIPFEWIGRA